MSRSLHALLLGSVAVLALAGPAIAAGPSAAQSQSNQPGPSSDTLLNAASDTANWMLPAGNYSDNR